MFQDPQLSQVVAQFQKNPQAALEAAKGNSEVKTLFQACMSIICTGTKLFSTPHTHMCTHVQTQNFLQEFCALMGDHFTQLADKETTSKPAANNAPLISEVSSSASPPSEDDEQMREKLAKPEVQRVLQEPEIQRLIVALKTKPEDAQRLVNFLTNSMYACACVSKYTISIVHVYIHASSLVTYLHSHNHPTSPPKEIKLSALLIHVYYTSSTVGFDVLCTLYYVFTGCLDLVTMTFDIK